MKQHRRPGTTLGGLHRLALGALLAALVIVVPIGRPNPALALSSFTLVAVDPAGASVSGASLAELTVVAGALFYETDISAGNFSGFASMQGSMAGDELSGTLHIEVRVVDNYGTEFYRITDLQFTTTPINTAGEVIELVFGDGVETDNLAESGAEETTTFTSGQRISYTVVAFPSEETTTVPAFEPEGFVEDATGTAYYSPADEADLEPAQRTWIVLQPGERVPLGDGAMLRTGAGGSILVRYASGSVMRLDASSLFTMTAPVPSSTPQSVVYGRLWEGYANFWSSGTNPEFGIETDRANTSVEGTIWQVAATADATRVSVFDGIVAVTDTSSGSVTDVPAGQTATVDDNGTRLTTNQEAGAVDPGPQPATLATPTAGTDTTAGTAPAAGTDTTSPSSGAPVASTDATLDEPDASELPPGDDEPDGGRSLTSWMLLGSGVVAAAAAVAAVWVTRRRDPHRPERGA